MGTRPPALLVAGAVVLLANSVYLAAVASPTLFFYGNVALHVSLGVVVAAAVLVYGLKTRRRWTHGATIGWVLFLGAAGSGLWLAYVGASRAHQNVLYTHGALAALAVLLAAVSLDRYATQAGSAASHRLGTAGVLLLCAAVVLPVLVRATLKRQWAAQYVIVNPSTAPDSMHGEGAGPRSPFFPSSARTTTGGTIPANFFMTSAACGRCHREIYDQWNGSAHHLSSFNNQWYRKSIEYMQDVIGTRPSKWCAGCHDHAVFFNGRFDKPIREQIDTPEAQAGLGCTSCHAITRVNSTMGQGG